MKSLFPCPIAYRLDGASLPDFFQLSEIEPAGYALHSDLSATERNSAKHFFARM